MRVVECCDGEFIFVRDPYKSVEVSCLITVDVDLDVAPDDIGQNFVFEAGREGFSLALRVGTPSVLGVLQLLAFCIGFSEVVGSIHTLGAVNTSRIFTTCVLDMPPGMGALPGAVTGGVNYEGWLYLHALRSVLISPSGLESCSLSTDRP